MAPFTSFVKHEPKTCLLRLLGMTILLISVGACTAPYPVPKDNLSLAEVQNNIGSHKNKLVAWGGIIMATDNKQNASTLTILAKPLDNFGQPIVSETSYGRFLARSSGFLDPAVFAPGCQVTVTGTIIDTENHKIGEYNYAMPVLNIETYRIWTRPPPPPSTTAAPAYGVSGYWWYDPWYPMYPVYPYPIYPVYPVPPVYPGYPTYPSPPVKVPPQHGMVPRK